MAAFEIHSVKVGQGLIALAQMPGRDGGLAADIDAIFDWGADLVVSLTEAAERPADLPQRLAQRGIHWLAVATPDYGLPHDDTGWTTIAAQVTETLSRGGRVLFHCMGGCGRSGMAVLRLMIAHGEGPDAALDRLRAIRPCAVETAEQLDWARQG